MPWLKLDDGMGEHRKTKRVLRAGGLRGLAAFGLHTLGLLHAAKYTTDGHVEGEMVEETFDLAKTKPADRTALTGVLVERGLWLPEEDGWMLHDYLEYNPSAERVAEDKRARSESAKAAANARWGNAS